MTAPRSIAFLSPRFAEGSTVGGAETLLKTLAQYAIAAGLDVTFLATCARNHFTWANELPAGESVVDGIRVRRFPVDGNRDLERFLLVQDRICRGRTVTIDEERDWIRHNVNSTALCDHLRQDGTRYDRIVMGPYLFGLIHTAAAIHPDRTVLVPCLHDEAFAYLTVFREMFASARAILFNSAPERDLAARLFGPAMQAMPVVGMGLPPFAVQGGDWARRRGIHTPYVLYSGRREPLKGTPLLLDYLDTFRQRTRKDIALVLTGSGPIHPPASLAPHIHDLGFVSEEDKHEAMAGAIAFCHPSVNESFGIVLLEAWLAGTPALVHARGAVLTHQCRMSHGGLWFRNYPEFEEELLLLLEQPHVRKTLGDAGRAYVQTEYAPARIQERLLQGLAR